MTDCTRTSREPRRLVIGTLDRAQWQEGCRRPSTTTVPTSFPISPSSLRSKNKEKPFFIYYPMALVHSPYWPTPDDHPADDKKDKNSKEHWQSNIEYTDKIVGKLIAALEEMGERDNTLFMFVGDNGTGGNGKAQTTEMGCRVPFIVNGPNLVKPIGACRELVDVSDILPTCCEVAGIEIPEDHAIDGVSFVPYLKGDMTPLREWIYGYLGGGRVVRTKRWLLEDNTMQDFGVLFDCGESRNGSGYVDVTELRFRGSPAGERRRCWQSWPTSRSPMSACRKNARRSNRNAKHSRSYVGAWPLRPRCLRSSS